ncbi:hypothetical protein GCM10009617_26080 [Leifsonia poae]|uniref:Uncharacterized protein n=2 Tax=Leifsonia poae TaxID=110933 RepID=A0A9W6HC58_9MICO|nr:hypothetical protein GCM10017584_27760 [Leifsonia poae]
MARAERSAAENRIRAAVADRSAELGVPVRSTDVVVDLAEDDVAPGLRLFRASWSGGRSERSLAGVLDDDDRPDTHPGHALGTVLRRWVETAGHLPAASDVAAAAAFLLDSDGRHRVLLTDEDTADVPGGVLPELVELPHRLGVSFWWTDGYSASRLTAELDEADRLSVNESTPGTDGRPTP